VNQREPFRVAAAGGELAGWVSSASAPPVLLLHGGPGLSFGYLDALADELDADFRVANFQQRGLTPSTLTGPFTIEQAMADVLAVLDGLQWPTAIVAGHSWGGYLALRLAAAHPERLDAAMAIDPLGIVGDGGTAGFVAELRARVSREDRERLDLLDADVEQGKLSAKDAALKSLELVWPAYFGNPRAAPPAPSMEMSLEAYAGIMAGVAEGAEETCLALARGAVRLGVVSGAGSPMPWGQAGLWSAEASPAGVFTLVPGAGHFPWLEVPGSVRDALVALTS
jgi:pimeloyl-ACP methyl ester carboxylesterase